MDYCSTESEFIESLDYLTLPVKRSTSFTKDSNLCGDLPTRTGLLRDYRKKVSHKTQTSHSLHKCNDSIILNSTKEEIVEYYAFVSSTENTPSRKFLAYLQSEEVPSQIKNQSFIKVTVAPKINKLHKPNVFTRRKQNTKHIHSTFSHEDQSIQTRNVYLVASGQKREKYYNIKTTESAKLLNDINKLHDDIPLEHVKNVKHVIHSLNMDKKRKKGRAVKKEKIRTGSPSKTANTSKVTENKEILQDKKQTEVNDKGDENEADDNRMKQAHSMVRITGQIGLGHNNQLLMKCGVEGRKAPANVELQTCSGQYSYFHNPGTILHTVTQGTQKNLEKVNTQREGVHRSKAPYYTENVACLCRDFNNVSEFDKALQNHNQAEKRQSPLVVITVYPNDERCESVKIYKQNATSSPVNVYGGYTDVNCMQETNHFSSEDKYYFHESDIEFADIPESKARRRPRSVSRILRENEIKSAEYFPQPISLRSQSQSTSSSHNVNRPEINNRDTNKSVPKGKKNSPPKSPRNQSSHKNYVQNTKQQVKGKSNPVKNQNEPKPIKGSNPSPKNRSPRSHSPRSYTPRSYSPSVSPSSLSTYSGQNNKNKGKKHQSKKIIESRQRNLKKSAGKKVTKPAQMTSAGTNTDHTWTKRVLVETFTKEVLNQMEKQNKDRSPQLKESQVTISIDGDNVNYDVIFQQGRRSTDVKVKKTKRPSAGRSYKDDNSDNGKTVPSLTNLLDVENIYGYESPSTNEKPIVPEIKVRDSLEIGHKRQHSPRLTVDNLNFPNLQAEISNTDSFAPVKHYTGDDCPIPDPVVRDKEIRHLLGIEKHRRSPPIPHFKTPDPGRHCRLQEETRIKQKVTDQYFEKQKNQTHQLNYLISPNRQSVGTQYELEVTAMDSPFSKKMILNRNIQVFLQVEKFNEQKPIMLSRKQYHKVKRAIEHTISKHPKQNLVKAKCSAAASCDFRKKDKILTGKGYRSKSHVNFPDNPNPTFANKDTTVLFTTDFKQKKESARHSVSSREMHISYSEPLNESSTKVTVGSAYSHSIHTIFKGFRKPRTPNLGTSTCSFYSEDSNEFYETSVKHFRPALEKPRKPFLRRLMSCLVLRTSTASGARLAAAPKPQASYNSCTVDSYHISTSLAALEMSSSIYDTSESFYSNHSILPINNKIKRSFFGSVRGLLSYGRN